MSDLSKFGIGNLQHVVETSTGSWILSIAEQPPHGTDCILEVDSRTIRVLKSYAGNYQCGPRHLALDGENNVFVAELANNSVALFVPSLQQQILKCPVESNPRRLNFDADSKLLMIGMYGGHLAVYNLHSNECK